jgi:hypothetical protein
MAVDAPPFVKASIFILKYKLYGFYVKYRENFLMSLSYVLALLFTNYSGYIVGLHVLIFLWLSRATPLVLANELWAECLSWST